MTRRPFLAALSVFGLAPTLAAAQAPAPEDRAAESDRRGVEAAPDAGRLRSAAPRRHRAPRLEPAQQRAPQGAFRLRRLRPAALHVETKFESGTGWPSFYTSIPGAVETKTDVKMIVPRTEYHCARCGGHQGHVFDDGPRPTGKRYCNNGVALKFVAAPRPRRRPRRP